MTELAGSPTSDVYASLAEVHEGDARWAFGSGFTEVEAELTAPVPHGADPADLAAYCLMIGDDALIYSHRLTEWVSNAPELEEDVALANIALDLLGQARLLLARAGHLTGSSSMAGSASLAGSSSMPGSASVAGRDEDRLAFQRDEAEFRNVALVELPDDGDFARCIARLLVFSTWRLALLQRLIGSADPVIAAVAAKGVKELAYHRDHAAQWTVRLGDGTPGSRARMQAGLDAVWPFVEELFGSCEVEHRLPGVAADPAATRAEVDTVLDQVLTAATLVRPDRPPRVVRGARRGARTEHLGHVLAVLQSLARQHPGASW